MPLLKLLNINKYYKSYDKPIDRLKEIILKKPYHHSHHVLNNISLTLQHGEAIGILGRNGAGKSTLLKILLGITLPDSGSIQSHGKITGLLELGSGFEPDLTGLENILTNGLLIGMTSAEIVEKKQQIIEFSELGEYINEPISTYSSGMVMRLAFSIAIFADPDCFIVDEALAVGDAAFQQKCFKKIKQFREKGGSLLFVSHDLNAVKMICDRTLVLDKGCLKFDGETEAGVNYYNRLLSKDNQEISSAQKQSTVAQHFGNNKAHISAAEIYQTDSHSQILSSGEQVTLKVAIQAKEDLDNVELGFLIRDRFGQDIYGTNTHHLNQTLSFKAGEEITVFFTLTMMLAPGDYTLTLALHSGINHIDECYFWRDNYLQFKIAGIKGHLFSGICSFPTQLKIQKEHETSQLLG